MIEKNPIKSIPNDESCRVTESLLYFQITIKKDGKQRYIQRVKVGNEELDIITTNKIKNLRVDFI